MIKRLNNDDEVEEAYVIDGTSEDITALQDDIDSQLDSIFQEFGGDENDTIFKIHVKRVMKNKGELEHCFSCLASELPVIDRIKNDFGAGAYEIWIYKDGKILKRPKLNIAKQIEKENTSTNDSNINSIISTILQSQKEQNEKFENLVVTISNNNNQPVFDPMSMMSSMVGMMAQMKDFINPQNGNDKFSEMIEVIKIVKEIGGDNEGSGRNFTDGMVDLAKAFGPGLIEVTSKLSDRASENNQSIQKAPVNMQEQPINKENTSDAEEQRMQMFKMQLGMLVHKASTGSDPALYADLVLDSIPEEKIREFISHPDVIGYLMSINPDVGNYKEWFTNLMGEINSALNEANETNEINETNEATVTHSSENNVINEIPDTNKTTTQANQ